MSEPTTPEEAIEQNILGPKRVQIGNQSVEQHDIASQIAGDNHLAAKEAASKTHLGLRFIKIIPPGCG